MMGSGQGRSCVAHVPDDDSSRRGTQLAEWFTTADDGELEMRRRDYCRCLQRYSYT